MGKVWSIAYNTFREAIRNRILYILLIFAIILILSSLVLGELTIGQHDRVIKDIGLATINIFSIIIAIFVGITLIYSEVDKKTIYTVISKPIKRWQYILGKYLGLLGTIYVIITLMALVFFVLIALTPRVSFSGYLLLPIFYNYLELSIITAMAVMFSSFTTPLLSGVYTLILFISGRLCNDLGREIIRLRARLEQGIIPEEEVLGEQIKIFIMDIVYRIIPNLENFNVRSQVVHAENLPEVISVAFNPFLIPYAGFYSALLLVIGIFIFNNKNLK